ncbi:phosphoglycerate mutase [Paraburkholderia caballeronis]|uniref:histidine phosphatase family protein n=1 Tax=Paraburkholderia caballeronis TaxID=416943 RepID=UPI0010656E24|nr:histidine phosphatase family protein [Paraburkholderia caballeronis]TDV36951.1 phosphoglycerate mutase [Paraburkholderia caballeronis]
MTTQILFIRHGETDWNRDKRIQGHLDIPLASTGVDQAQRLGARLADDARAGLRLDAILSSDLTRAQQTAQPAAAALGLAVQRAPGLRERSYGLFQGLDSDEIAARFPDEYAQWQSRDPGFAPPEGESLRELYHRVLHALEPVIAAYPEGRVACVTHGGVLDCVYRFARGIALDVRRDWPLLNASVNIVDFDTDGYVTQANIVSWADVGHLEGESSDDGIRRPS